MPPYTQKCAIYNATSGGGHEVRYTHDQSDTQKPQALSCDVTGPGYDAHIDRRAPRHTGDNARGGELERGQSAPGA